MSSPTNNNNIPSTLYNRRNIMASNISRSESLGSGTFPNDTNNNTNEAPEEETEDAINNGNTASMDTIEGFTLSNRHIMTSDLVESNNDNSRDDFDDDDDDDISSIAGIHSPKSTTDSSSSAAMSIRSRFSGGRSRGGGGGSLSSSSSRFARRRSCTSFSSSMNKNNQDGGGGGGRGNIWSEMTQIGFMSTLKDVWKEQEDYLDCESEYHDSYYDENMTRCSFVLEEIKYFLHGVKFEALHRLKTACEYPHILGYSLFVFIGLTVLSLRTISTIGENMQHSIDQDATLLALQTASWFAEVFAKSLIPLRSLQQAVIHSQALRELPYKIGNLGERDAVPLQYDFGAEAYKLDHRDVSGICDDPSLMKEFQSIVEGINANFGFEDIIITYRIAPYGVYCLANPQVKVFQQEEEELSDSVVLNNTAQIGFDPIRSENMKLKNMLKDIYHNKNQIHMFGPNNQFMGIEGNHMMCGHLAVEIPGYNYVVDNTRKSIWGFVMHFIQWSELKKQSKIDLTFKEKEYSFKLTRTDLVVEEDETKATEYVDAIIAENDPWPDTHRLFETNEEPFTPDNSVQASVNTQDSGDWTMHVKSHKDFKRELYASKIIAVMLSFIVSCMVAANLIEKKLNKLLLYKIMPTDAIKKLNRGQTVIESYNIVTIFFSDIVGFTSMCGEMKPLQIMKMLNELYMQFDKLVAKHGVYKVETIGDAYMVVGGAPHRIPAPEAAQKVALFALEAMDLVKTFKTSDGDKVIIRAGIASGPVVAGVVGKAMPRYCFFGDTVNLASRMESNSQPIKIQCSDFTSCLLTDAPNYTFDLKRREELINMKGKGLTQTHWIQGVTGGRDAHLLGLRDLEWGASARKLVIQNPLSSNKKDCNNGDSSSHVVDPFVQCMALSEQPWKRIGLPDSTLVRATSDPHTMVARISSILEYRLSLAFNNPGAISDQVKKEISEYVKIICDKYNDVHFHNFEHASHITISMNKLVDLFQKKKVKLENERSSAHHGKTARTRRNNNNKNTGADSSCATGECDSDSSNQEDSEEEVSSLTLNNSSIYFVLLFATLIHDVEHTGKTNEALSDEGHKFAKKYPNGSFQECNSIDVSLKLLAKRKFRNLRQMIYRIISKESFEMLLKWSLLATDIMCKKNNSVCLERFHRAYDVKQQQQREQRGRKKKNDLLSQSFSTQDTSLSFDSLQRNLEEKLIMDPTQRVAIENIIQLADISHCCQCWETFTKWNYRLYKECMNNYEIGRHHHQNTGNTGSGSSFISNPSDNWSKGQIMFLTNYVIPLVQRSISIFGGCLNNSDNKQDDEEKEEEGGVEGEILLLQSAIDNLERWKRDGDHVTNLFISGYASRNDREYDTLLSCAYLSSS